MLADIYDTIKALVYNGFPTKSGYPVVYDKVIKGWYYGERAILSETPGVLFQGQTTSPKDGALAIRELEHNITITCFDRADNNELLERNVLEFSRLMHECLLPHRRMWVLTKCPMCPLSTQHTLTKWSMSPIHYVSGHSGILGSFDDAPSSGGSYVAQSKYDKNQIWLQTHTSSYSGWDYAGLSLNAFYMLYDVVKGGHSGTLPPDSYANFQSFISQNVRPARLLYDCVLSSIKAVEVKNDNALFRGGEFTISCKELIKITDFGPNNVSTTLWG